MNFHKNYAEIIGNLGENPKYILSTQGQPRYIFDICSNEAYKEGEEWKSRPTWIKCTAWGNLATTLSRMQFAKGDRVMVEGKLRNNNWVNAQSGEQHNEIYVLVTEMRKMAKAKSSGNSQGNSANAQGSQGQSANGPQGKNNAAYRNEEERQMQADLEDLPF